jgi:hypothetical protein
MSAKSIMHIKKRFLAYFPLEKSEAYEITILYFHLSVCVSPSY